MATIQNVVDATNEFFGGSKQTPPPDTLVRFHAQGSVDAINAIRRYVPREDEPEQVLEDKYLALATRITVYLCSKEGVDGVVSFSENGISRSYETGDIPGSMLRTVTPICKGW